MGASERERYKVLGAGIFSLVLVMGVARFSYTPLLPLMRQQAHLSLLASGWLAALNYAGYLSGALLASQISDLALKDKLYRIGMVMAVLSTALMAASTNVWIWAVSRYVGGLCTAAGMLLGTGLIMNWLIRHEHRSELGIHFSGVGLGIAISAVAAAVMLSWGLDWREQWLAFAGLGCLLLWPALRWLPRPGSSTASASAAAMADKPPGQRFLRLFMASYFCAGVGYVVSTTFIVAIVDALPGLKGRGTWVFMVMGLAAAPSSILWDLIARRTGDVAALVIAGLLQIVGILLPVWPGGLNAAMLGSVLFGSTFIGMVSLVLTMAGRYYPSRPAKMMGKMTLSYGCAQIIGPALTAWLAQHFGSYGAGLYMAAAVMVVGVGLLLMIQALARPGAQTSTGVALPSGLSKSASRN